MANTVQDVTDRVMDILVEDGTGQWLTTELVNWYNSGQLAIATAKFDANSILAAVALAQGIKQSLTIPALAIGRITRNMGSTGLVPGAAITLTDFDILTLSDPTWTTTTSTSTVKHYMLDPLDPLTFWVYPGNSGGSYVEIEYSKPPATIVYDAGPGTWATMEIEIKPGYFDTLVDYVLWRAFSKDTGSVGNLARAEAYEESYCNSVGLKVGGRRGNSR